MDIRFVMERETKNTLRYQESAEDEPVVGTLYIKKSAARAIGDGQYPQALTVTVEASTS